MSTPALTPRVAALIERTRATRGRLIFALDATGSRQPQWDLAASLQQQMFEEAARVGGLDVQLVHYGGDQLRHSPWLADAGALTEQMRAVRCVPGPTQIERVLRHIRAENERQKIAAGIFVGDASEERPGALYDAAAGLGVPLFMFLEDDNWATCLNEFGGIAHEQPPVKVEQIFRELARLSGGAFGRFDAGAAKQLGELLRAVAAFAVGGVAALANQHTDAGRKLLGQMKHKEA